ncbi:MULTISPECIES: sugar ABC transporter substrate-binding protein [Spirulina sp. CCY15215]|uniref:sugar ABC transporter substrate-binding protein n=1 Tax=Spirulina sp. CCY15215 TaxID=2767591 RepID=UPI00194DCC1D|nr:sugar ABC transporter substrate-binding protein [Spirulina major]
MIKLSPLFLSLTIFAISLGCQPSQTQDLPQNLSQTPKNINNSAIAPSPNVSESKFKIPQTEIKATKPWHILVVVKDTFDPKTGKHGDLYQEQVWQGAMKAGADFGVKVELLANTCHTCVEDQIRAISERVDAGGINGIVIMVTDSIRVAPVIEKAIARGISVVAMDTPLNSDKILTFVVFDNVAGGKVMGEWLVQKLGGQGRVLILDGALEQQNAVDRREGFLAGLRTGKIDILETKSAAWSQEEAKEITQQWLQKYNNINAIIAANYAMSVGASEAVREANLQDKIIVTGFDAMPPALQSIKEGAIAATIDQTPDLQARLSIQLLLRHLENRETFPPRVLIPNIPLIDRDTIDN